MLNNKSIIAIIPARGGSKGVPRKNLRMLANGKSLLAHTIHIAKESRYLDRIIVSTEDAEIMEAALKAGAEVPFARPPELASDTALGYEPIVHALHNLPHYDYVLVLQATSPLRNIADIDGALEFCLSQNALTCVSVTAAEKSPYWMYNLTQGKVITPLMDGKIPLRRQELPVVYSLNGAIYIAETTSFLKTKSFLTSSTLGYVMPKARSLDLDTEFDFQIVDLYFKNTALRNESPS